jgi:hypothetical protein
MDDAGCRFEEVSGRPAGTRMSEWFVPSFGPEKFRAFVGLLFLPYTGMVLSYAVIGSMLAERIFWDRVIALVIIYFLGLGVAAHALDALGSKGVKPWGRIFSRNHLWLIAICSLCAAYLLAIYYMIRFVPWLWTVAVLEGFFVFAYNLETLGGRFHTDMWFVFSWGFLPVCAGFLMQTNTLSPAVLVLAASTALLSLVEITVSRPYKELRRRVPDLSREEILLMNRYEKLLESISLGVILLGSALLLWRMT